MGQVFTWSSILCGEVPKREDFDKVALILREILRKEPSIVSALLFGSVVRLDFNIRSDIDCAILYKTDEEPWAMRAAHKAQLIAGESHVPINFVPCDTVLAQTRLHHFGPAFIEHLQASIGAGGLIKGDFFEGSFAPTAPAEQEIEWYIRTKMYTMQESLAQMMSFSEERLVGFLKKALEAPMHVARKMLFYKGTQRGDSKKEVQERYGQIMPAHLGGQLDHLLGVDSWYSLTLPQQVKAPSRNAHVIALDKLKSELPEVLKFLRANILYLNHYTEAHH